MQPIGSLRPLSSTHARRRLSASPRPSIPRRRWWVALAFVGGCANHSSFQEVDTIAANHAQVGGALTVSAIEVPRSEFFEGWLTYPAANLWFRYGITDDLEVHSRAWLPLGASAGAKYQLLGDRAARGFGLAVGTDLGFVALPDNDGGSISILDVYVPIHTGYRVSEGFSTYLTPKYLLRVANFEDDSVGAHNLGATLGIAVGTEVKMYAEGSGAYTPSTGHGEWTGGLGIGVGL